MKTNYDRGTAQAAANAKIFIRAIRAGHQVERLEAMTASVAVCYDAWLRDVLRPNGRVAMPDGTTRRRSHRATAFRAWAKRA